MTDDFLLETWRRGGDGGRAPSAEDLEAAHRAAAAPLDRALRLTVLAHLPLLSVAVALGGANMYLCRAQAGPLAAQAALTVIAVGFLAFGRHLLRDLRAAARGDEPVAHAIARRLDLCRVKFEIWQVIVAAGVMMAGLGAAALADNLAGGWRVNNPTAFAQLELAGFAFIYLLLKASLHPTLAGMRALLAGLEAQTGDGIAAVARSRRRWRRYGLPGIVACTALLVWLVWRTTQALG
jgi:hypothetical protein